jgi:hypothetical protein
MNSTTPCPCGFKSKVTLSFPLVRIEYGCHDDISSTFDSKVRSLINLSHSKTLPERDGADADRDRDNRCHQRERYRIQVFTNVTEVK